MTWCRKPDLLTKVSKILELKSWFISESLHWFCRFVWAEKATQRLMKTITLSQTEPKRNPEKKRFANLWLKQQPFFGLSLPVLSHWNIRCSRRTLPNLGSHSLRSYLLRFQKLNCDNNCDKIVQQFWLSFDFQSIHKSSIQGDSIGCTPSIPIFCLLFNANRFQSARKTERERFAVQFISYARTHTQIFFNFILFSSCCRAPLVIVVWNVLAPPHRVTHENNLGWS